RKHKRLPRKFWERNCRRIPQMASRQAILNLLPDDYLKKMAVLSGVHGLADLPRKKLIRHLAEVPMPPDETILNGHSLQELRDMIAALGLTGTPHTKQEAIEILMGQSSNPSTATRKRILSGVQPSGKLHLGNYFGAIKQHIELQHEGQCYYFIADYHALTTLL